MLFDITDGYNVEMEDFKRLEKIFKQRQLEADARGETFDQIDLANALNPPVSQTAISKWMKAKPGTKSESLIPDDRVPEIAEILEVRIDEISPLVAAKIEAAAANLPISSKVAFRQVKVLAGDKVVDLIAKISKGKAPKITEFRHCPQNHSDSTYALQQQGEAMSAIPDGSWLYVDVEQSPEIGKPVLLLRGKSWDVANWKGNNYCEFTNPDYPDRIFRITDKDHVIGRVIQVEIIL